MGARGASGANSTVAPSPTNPTVSTAPNVGIGSVTTTSLDNRQTGGVQPRTDTATTTDNVVGTIPVNGTVNTATTTLENRQVGGVQTNTNTNIASKLSSVNGTGTQTVQTQPLGGQGNRVSGVLDLPARVDYRWKWYRWVVEDVYVYGMKPFGMASDTPVRDFLSDALGR